jgi:coenzyme PQQ precursor peptide PqqA
VKALDLRRTANAQNINLTKRVGLDIIRLIRRLVPHKKSVCTNWRDRSNGLKEFGMQQNSLEEAHMKIWSKPAVRETEVGLEVTSYLPAEIDVI